MTAKKMIAFTKFKSRSSASKLTLTLCPMLRKSADGQSVFRILTQGIEIDAGRRKKGDISRKKYISLLRAARNLAPRNSMQICVKPLIKMTTILMK